MKELIQKLKAIRNEVGYSAFDNAIKSINRERLFDREKRERRKHFSPKVYQSLFDKQKGVCNFCKLPLDIPARQNEIDHRDVNAEDYNGASNLQLLHKYCNRTKSSKSLIELSKQGHGTFREQLE